MYGNDNYCLLLHRSWDSGILGICSPDWSGHRPYPPGCILCCSLWCFSVSLPSHHYSCALSCLQSSLILFSCPGSTGFSCSIPLTTHPLSPVFYCPVPVPLNSEDNSVFSVLAITSPSISLESNGTAFILFIFYSELSEMFLHCFPDVF